MSFFKLRVMALVVLLAVTVVFASGCPRPIPVRTVVPAADMK